MVVGIDLDNTITDIPWMFAIISKALVDAGHEVHVITYRERGDTEQEMKGLGMTWTKVHFPEDHPLGGGSIPKWKAAVVKELNVSVMFEDSPENLAELPPDVKRIWICDPEIFDLNKCLKGLNE